MIAACCTWGFYLQKKTEMKLSKLQTPSKLQTKLAKTLEWPTVPFSFKVCPASPSCLHDST